MTTQQYAKVANKNVYGGVRRFNDPLTHLGPPESFEIPGNSPLFETRCGLNAGHGQWWYEDNQLYCVWCAVNGGLTFRVMDLKI